MTSFDKKFGHPKTSLSCELEWLSISNLKKLENNARPGEGEMIAIMKRKSVRGRFRGGTGTGSESDRSWVNGIIGRG